MVVVEVGFDLEVLAGGALVVEDGSADRLGFAPGCPGGGLDG